MVVTDGQTERDRGREFQLLGEDTQKAPEAKDDLTQEGTASVL